MDDVLEILAGGGLTILGILIGRFMPGRRRVDKQPKAICGCGHAYAFHNKETSACNHKRLQDMYNKKGDYIGKQPVGCPCERYDGPTPLGDIIANEIIG